MTENKGSLSVEGAIAVGVALLVLSLLFSFFYANHLYEKVYDNFALWVIENNIRDLSPSEFSIPYLEVKGEHFMVFERWESPIPAYTSYGDAADFTVYVSDTGKKYHKKGCPYLATSKKTMKYKEARGQYSPCGKCFP